MLLQRSPRPGTSGTPRSGLRRSPRHALAALSAGALAVGVAAPAGVALAAPASATATASPTTGTASSASSAAVETALSEAANCTNSSGHLLVQFMVDSSGSLRETDPADDRVGAVTAGLSVLEQASASNDSLVIDVSIATFDESYRAETDWTRLDSGSLDDVTADARGLADADHGRYTDYEAALQGAQGSFARQSAVVTSQTGTEPCKVLLWFTDGKYDVGSSSAEAAGLDALCRPDGVADQLRRDRVVNFAFLLTAQVEPADRELVQAIAEGSAPGASCGTAPIPTGWASGAYVEVDDMTEVVAKLYGALALVNNGTAQPPTETEICDVEVCEEGAQSLTIDPGLSSFNVLALTGSETVEVVLTSPEGDSLRVTAGENLTGTVGGATASATWLTSDGVLIAVELPEEAGDDVGVWTLTFVDPEGAGGTAESQVYVFGSFSPRIAEDDLRFEAGEPVAFTVEVVRSDGEPLSGGVFSDVAVTASVRDPGRGVTLAAPLTEEEPGRYTGTFTAPSDIESSNVNVNLQLDLVTESGLALRPVLRSYAVPVRPPSAFPVIEPAELRLDAIEGVEPAVGELTLVGSDVADSCVWLEEASFSQVPGEAGAVSTSGVAATGVDSCLAVPRGESVTLPVQVVPEAEANGSVRGEIVLTMTSAGADEQASVRVPVAFDMVKAVDRTTQLGVLLALLALGVGGPLAAMYLLNYRQAKFRAPGNTYAVAVPVTVTNGVMAPRNTSPGAVGPLGVAFEDLRPLQAPRTDSRLFAATVEGTRGSGQGAPLTFRAVLPRLPFSPPAGRATAAGAYLASGVSGSSVAGRTAADGRSAPVRLDLPGTVLVLLAPQQPATQNPGGPAASDVVEASVVVIVSRAQADRQLAQVSQAAPRVVSDAIAALRSHADAGSASDRRSEPAGGGTTHGSQGSEPASGIPAPRLPWESESVGGVGAVGGVVRTCW